MLDFDKLAGLGAVGSDVIEPRKIFSTLIRNPRFKFLSDNQGEVLEQWFSVRARSDNTIKMNTGSGKMLVGLLCLQSSINEKIFPAVYVCPDNHLVEQVIKEAYDLGIPVSKEPRDPNVLSGKSVLVINIDRLVNGRSVFGVGNQGIAIPIGSLVIDDAHACLQSVTDQFTICSDSQTKVYQDLIQLFEEDLKKQSPVGYQEIKDEDPRGLLVVPFWAWHQKLDQVIAILHANRNSDDLIFNWPLLKETISLCQCVFGTGYAEIFPRCLPIDEIPSFTEAKRRIYMTATLADDSVLITKLNANPQSISQPIKPKGAGDIGDRMIIAPQEVNPTITETDIKTLAEEVSKSKNVVVIVPSKKRAQFWEDIAYQTLTRDNISKGIELLRSSHVGLTVLINRYDGVDLPDEACRLLIIDGLPEVSNLRDRQEANLLDGSQLNLFRQIQRLEQGMGRGVRSAEDFCAILLLGARLVQRINQPDVRRMFTPATLAQMELGREVTRQLQGKPIGDLRGILDLCMNKDPQWWQAGRTRLAKAPEGISSHIEPSAEIIRKAFDSARQGQYQKASSLIEQARNVETDKFVKGYLGLQLAEYYEWINPAQAQEILISSLSDNKRITKPLQGITYSKLSSPTNGQAAAAINFMSSRFVDSNTMVIWGNALLGDLSWDKQRTENFESAIQELGLFLGFGSQRPEKDYRNGGPDNLWAMGDLRFLVIECKSGAEVNGFNLISKDYCNQLNGSTTWFRTAYDDTCKATPILIHPSHIFHKEASPTGDMRIIDEEQLKKLKKNIFSYIQALASGQKTIPSQQEVVTQLKHFAFTGSSFVDSYTTKYKVET